MLLAAPDPVVRRGPGRYEEVLSLIGKGALGTLLAADQLNVRRTCAAQKMCHTHTYARAQSREGVDYVCVSVCVSVSVFVCVCVGVCVCVCVCVCGCVC